MESAMSYIDYINTPIGSLAIKASEKGITHVIFVKEMDRDVAPNVITDRCKQQLGEYFNSQRKEFDIPFDQQGTHFQCSVWQSLLSIPYGELASYQEIANIINNPKAVRAVGAANGKNPIAIIIPCHRVIGSNGSLTGYAGGLERKTWLLEHEANQSGLFSLS